jgi:trans-aconitate 2-methyltransferase
MPSWDDKQYLRFEEERTRPACELLARVPLEGATQVIDLGSGPGNSTRLLRNRWPEARVVGVDNSEQMLARARADWPRGEWVLSDAQAFASEGPTDLIFANASLHWVPEHEALFPRLIAQLAAGGVLAIQMPQNFSEPSHLLMRELGTSWKSRFDVVPSAPPVHSPQQYYDLLAPVAARLDIWQTTYQHVMPDVPAIVDWVKGSGLRPFLAALSLDEQAAYLEAYSCALDAAYPRRADGKRLFAFSRIFIVAVR